jgi:hypothetical protein
MGKNRVRIKQKPLQGKEDLEKKLNLVKFVFLFVTFVVQAERKLEFYELQRIQVETPVRPATKIPMKTNLRVSP